MSLVSISRNLCRQVDRLRFAPPVAHVYNPLDYARRTHEAYLRRYGDGPKQVVLLGMNPGPFGMAQTGVPFGDVASARDFLGISGQVDRPPKEHPKRPVLGFDCPRAEVSGTRVWGWVRARFGTPARFFERFLVLNYCPLVFMEGSGRNRTPDKLPKEERKPLLAACDAALVRSVEELRPKWVIGVGNYARDRAKACLADRGMAIGSILHPSPANPRANRGWAQVVDRQLHELGIVLS
ncbi:MAG: single-stranded DNA-binding protein [Deltaproteobacteria bacterium]|jgi:single-strand selective monofunctional uracil DNA glycosylase|nr:single-stranded DNA-binding protein [Deltaproteobacteria bacterium]MBW2532116.1 single-stranded DNA-binding protein [Deltaproteobacteria bacterium]